MSGITVDVSGALKKNEMVKNIPKATRKQLEAFGATTVQELKLSARSKLHRHSGRLFGSPGHKLYTEGDTYKLLIGTNVKSMGGNLSEKYAMIQDKGGTVVPRAGHKYLTVPFPGVQGTAKDYPGSFLIKTHGNLFIVQEKFGHRGGGKYVGEYKGLKFLFVLKKKVTIKASHWFTSVWERRVPLLNSQYLNDKVILRIAESMSGGHNA